MPTYPFRCGDCDQMYVAFRAFDEYQPDEPCPRCDGAGIRQYVGTQINLNAARKQLVGDRTHAEVMRMCKGENSVHLNAREADEWDRNIERNRRHAERVEHETLVKLADQSIQEYVRAGGSIDDES